MLSAALLFVLSSCGEYEKLLKSRDYQKKYETGLSYYEDGEFVKSATLFDQVAGIFRGTIKADTVKYYQAMSYYGQRDYMMAGHYFSELSVSYPNSTYLEESDFMIGYCYYMQSPRPQLDQTTTMQAINSMQMFMVKHPNSDKLNQCQEIIVEMSDKLVEKSFISARLYYDLGYYDSAIIALRNSLSDYPDTQFREDLMFLILKSSYLLAEKSIFSKQRERYQATIDEYFSFIGEFPEGKNAREATRMYENSQAFLGENNKES